MKLTAFSHLAPRRRTVPDQHGKPTDVRAKLATARVEFAHDHRADKALRRFSWEDGA